MELHSKSQGWDLQLGQTSPALTKSLSNLLGQVGQTKNVHRSELFFFFSFILSLSSKFKSWALTLSASARSDLPFMEQGFAGDGWSAEDGLLQLLQLQRATELVGKIFTDPLPS